MPKSTSNNPSTSTKASKANKTSESLAPLADRILGADDASAPLRAQPRLKRRKNEEKSRRAEAANDNHDDDNFKVSDDHKKTMVVDAALTRKVFQSLQDQMEEEGDDDLNLKGIDMSGAREEKNSNLKSTVRELSKTNSNDITGDDEQIPSPSTSAESSNSNKRQRNNNERSTNNNIHDDILDMDSDDDEEDNHTANSNLVVDKDGYVNVISLENDEEEKALEMFMPKNEKKTFNLGDALMEAIQRKKAEEEEAMSMNTTGTQSGPGSNSSTVKPVVPNDAVAGVHSDTKQLSPKVIQVYSEIAKWLKTYKSGKMPKPFLVIPSLSNWEEILCLTNPLDWSPNAMREGVKIFASQLNSKMAQRFYNLVLLPAVRNDLAENDKLNFHYFESLKKAMFKPSAFMKGILLPLLQESCTLKEAHILSTILSKISVPVLHASAVLIKLSLQSPWYGSTSMIMTSLINKKYALPTSVIKHLTDHYYSFVEDSRQLPLVWHRGLLVFIQRYRKEIVDQGDFEKMKHLLKVHWHEGIGPECRRELGAGVFGS